MSVMGTAMCRKVSNMGNGAAKSHMKSKQHNQIMKHKQSPYTQSTTDFFGATNESVPTPTNLVNKFHPLWLFTEQTDDVSTVPVSSPSTSLIMSEKVLHAEVLWAIEVITSHYSFSSCKDISCLFSKMFSDSQIVQSFSCGATKCAYLACFGIYPYFHELLIEKIRAVKYYT